MSAWQPIETAPKDGTWILGVRQYKQQSGKPDVWTIPTSLLWHDGRWCQGCDCDWDFKQEVKPTHWMPLPQPPVECETELQQEQAASLPSEAK